MDPHLQSEPNQKSDRPTNRSSTGPSRPLCGGPIHWGQSHQVTINEMEYRAIQLLANADLLPHWAKYVHVQIHALCA